MTTASLPAAGSNTPQPTAWLLRIELRGLRPVIYREVLVAPDMPLHQLHSLIQAAMGWENAHLYGFAIPGTGRTASYWDVPPRNRYEPDAARMNDPFMDEPARSDAKTKLSQVMTAPRDKLLYLYDFGDDWEHVITLKKITTTDAPLPTLVKAQIGCPPEDCGGPPGFAQWAMAWHDANDPEHETARAIFEETGREPGQLDFGALQKAVQRLQKPGKNR